MHGYLWTYGLFSVPENMTKISGKLQASQRLKIIFFGEILSSRFFKFELGGGFKCVLLSPLFGKIPILTNIFQMG